MSGGTTATLTVLATAVSMYAQQQQQKTAQRSAEAAAEYNAQVAENEAAAQQQLAQNEISKGIADRERQHRAAARAMGEMRANMGAGGFEMDSGSNLSLLAESAAEHQYDIGITTRNADMAAWQYQRGQASALNNKAFADYQYANAGSGQGATNLAMAGTLLGSIGKSIGQYNEWQKLKPATTGKVKLGKNG
jgi:hypothetical protein